MRVFLRYTLEEAGAAAVKIIDLGLAKAVSEAGSQTTISIPGGFAGTPEFASPEQFAGAGVDVRSDLYSLGVMLWKMVTGHVLFRGSPARRCISINTHRYRSNNEVGSFWQRMGSAPTLQRRGSGRIRRWD